MSMSILPFKIGLRFVGLISVQLKGVQQFNLFGPFDAQQLIETPYWKKYKPDVLGLWAAFGKDIRTGISYCRW